MGKCIRCVAVGVAVLPLMLSIVAAGREAGSGKPMTAWEELPGFKRVSEWRVVPGYHHIRIGYDSPSNQRVIHTNIYVPDEYVTSSDARFPVLYVLQIWEGFLGPGRRFLQEHPMILVTWSSSHPAPDRKGGRDSGWWIDSIRRPKCQLETFFEKELHPFMAEHFRIQDKAGITGFSSGAYAAHLYMLKNPDLFACVSGFDARYFAAGYGGTMHTHISRWYGSYKEHKKLHDAHSLPLLLKAHMEKQNKLPPMFSAVGTRDYLLSDNRRWVKLLSHHNLLIIRDLFRQKNDLGLEEVAKKGIFSLRGFMRSDFFKKEYPKRCIDYQYLETDGIHSVAAEAVLPVLRFHWKHFEKHL